MSTALCLALMSVGSLALAQGAPEATPAEATPAEATPTEADPAEAEVDPVETTGATRVLVVPIAVRGANLDAAAKQVTAALAAAATNSGAAVETSAASRAQVTDLSDCKNEAPACMQEMLDAVSADVIILGNLVATEGGLILTVKQVKRGEPDKVDTHVLKGADSPELGGQIDAIAASTFDSTVAKPIVKDAPPRIIDKPPDGSSFDLSRVNTAAWAVTGTGAGLVVVGAVMLAVASGKQGDVDSAPDETLDDINKLRDMEDSAKRFELFGNSFLIAGAVTTAAGITWAVLQARRGTPAESQKNVVLAPSPTRGGAMVHLTWFQ